MLNNGYIKMENMLEIIIRLLIFLFVVCFNGITCQNQTEFENITTTTKAPCLKPENPPITWSVNSFPNPQLNTTLCGRRCKKSWICDPNNLIKPQQADYLDSKIEGIRTHEKCACWENCRDYDLSYKFSVAIVPYINITSGCNGTEVNPYNFARDLGEKWNFKECNDDILILLFPNSERKVYTSVGSRLEETLNDHCVYGIIQESQPKLSSAMYAGALDEIIDKYWAVLLGGTCDQHYIKIRRSTEDTLEAWVIVIIVLASIVGLCILLCIILRSCGYRLRTKEGRFSLQRDATDVLDILDDD